VGARFSAPIQTGPGAHPAFYTTGTGSFPGGKAAGAWRWAPTPSIMRVKERVEPYLHSPTGPSWSVVGWALPLPPQVIHRSGGGGCTHPGRLPCVRWHLKFEGPKHGTRLVPSPWYCLISRLQFRRGSYIPGKFVHPCCHCPVLTRHVGRSEGVTTSTDPNLRPSNVKLSTGRPPPKKQNWRHMTQGIHLGWRSAVTALCLQPAASDRLKNRT